MITLFRFLVPVIIAFGCQTSLRAAFPEEAAAANHSLASGHAAEALSSCEALLSSPTLASYSSPELWYHRGLAEEKIGDLAAASLSYRRALLLDPTLAPARTRLVSVLDTLGLPEKTNWQDQLLRTAHPDLLILGGAILGWIGIFILIFLILHGPRRPILIALSLTACVLGHGISLLGTFTDQRRLASQQAVVTSKGETILRDTPADSAKAEGTLAPGSFLTILSRNGVWWKVSNGSATGWILSNALTPLLPTSVGS